MKVTVRLFAMFRDFSPTPADPSPLIIDVDAHARVRDLLSSLCLPEELPRIILVNGLLSMENRKLREGDVISIFPPLIGGGF